MSKHTEGPWFYTEDEVVDEYGGTIADASARRHFPGAEARTPEVEAEIQANVCLMAAAPNLLSALTEIENAIDDEMDEWQSVERAYLPLAMAALYDIREVARIAITEAKGESEPPTEVQLNAYGQQVLADVIANLNASE